MERSQARPTRALATGHKADEVRVFPTRDLARVKMRFPTVWKARAMRVSDHAPVMLHLRACHASKAAILTIPAILLPVENRSPA
jgi:hypothetical protein